MQTRILSQEEWLPCLNALGRHCEKWFVTIELLGLEIEADLGAREWPLQAIDVELNGGPDDSISFQFGDGDTVFRRTVTAPKRVRLSWTEKGLQEAICIDSAHGFTLLARFRPATAPQQAPRIPL
ncbi:MAG: hypothetical protein AB1813_10110 [Verrucomicrobiota bacterium]|jgi:hypothetical protein